MLANLPDDAHNPAFDLGFRRFRRFRSCRDAIAQLFALPAKRFSPCWILTDLPIQRYVRVKGDTNPYGPSWQDYFAQRVAMKSVGM